MSKLNSYNILSMEAIVISGMGGRFPESDSTDEFAENMYKNLDLITEDDRRWPTTISGMNHRMGRLKNIDKLDGAFFGNMKVTANDTDPQSRILLETTYEAIIDAGINPQTLQGSNTGVYIGFTPFGAPEGLEEELQPDIDGSVGEIRFLGSGTCLYANRLSYMFDFKGPSLCTDTGCSSSGIAFDIAMRDLRTGIIDQAIVGGAQISLVPWTCQLGQFNGMNAGDGIPKVWDKDANGFVRAEGVVSLFLQRKSKAKRIYATVLNTGTNNDGHKKEGIAFPSHVGQHQLMARVMREANVDPKDVTYFEPHGTGTKTGDTQEATSIYNTYCLGVKRDKPLLIGMLKSITGHQESAAGVSSVVKALLAFENQCIPKNLHLNEIKSTIIGFCGDKQLFPVRENTEYNPGITGINNFGIGGSNAHILIEPNYKTSDEKSLKIVDSIPRLINICCRSEEAFNQMCDWIESHPKRVSRELLALMADTMRTLPSLNSSGFPYRGSLIIKQLSDQSYEYKRQYSLFERKTQTPVWFVFSGLGGEWVAMAKALMPIRVFADSIEECHRILCPHGIDLKHLLLSEDMTSMSAMLNKFCAKTALQISLINVLKTLEISADGIIGHSFGEIAAAYADGCLTVEEAIMASFLRGLTTDCMKDRIPIEKGGMAVVGLSWDEADIRCPEGVEVVGHNDEQMVVISGLEKNLKNFIQDLKREGVFVNELESSGIPYHSSYMKTSADLLRLKLKDIITDPKPRSKKWLSTATRDVNPSEQLNYASGDYFAHNLISPVFFYDRVKQIPDEAVVVEIGPHPLFSGLMKRCVKNGDYVSFLKKDSNDTNLDLFFSSVAKLYELGLNPVIENLYEKVEWPVPRGTQSIGSLMKWDHQDTYFIKRYPEFYCRSTASDMNIKIDLKSEYKPFLTDHRVDGNVVYPGVGYLMLAWRQMAANYHKLWNEIPVILEDIKFKRPVFLSETQITKINVKYLSTTGDFSILESDEIVCSGKVKPYEEQSLKFQHLLSEEEKSCEVVLTGSDIYKDLRINGYDYGQQFQNLMSIKTNDFKEFHGQVKWTGNIIPLFDSLLQSSLIVEPLRQLRLPVAIKTLKCNPKLLYEAIDKNQSIVDSIDEEIRNEQEQSQTEVNQAELTSTYIDTTKLKNDFRLFDSKLDFYFNSENNILVSKGIEIQGFCFESVPRQSNDRNLQLDSYQFVSNNQINAIHENHMKSMMEYIKNCTLVNERMRNGGQNMLNHPDDKSMLDLVPVNMTDEKILLKSFLSIEIENNNQDMFKSYINDHGMDQLDKVSKNELLIRPFVELFSENNIPKKVVKVLEINFSKDLLAEGVENYIQCVSTMVIDVDYTIAVNSLDSIPEEYKKKSYKSVEWKASDSMVFPKQVKDRDLIVFRDSYDFWPLNLEKQIKQKSYALVDRGFLLSLFRHQLTEPEVVLFEMNGKKDINNELKLRIEKYLQVARLFGFVTIGHKSDPIGWTSVLLRKMISQPTAPLNDNIIEINENISGWLDKLQQQMKKNIDGVTKENIWLIGSDPGANSIVGLVKSLRYEPGGEFIRCINGDQSLNFEKDFTKPPFSHILSNDLAINVIKEGRIGTLRYVTLTKDWVKTETDIYYISKGFKRDVSELQCLDLRHFWPIKRVMNTSNQWIDTIVKCHNYYNGFNHLDLEIIPESVTSRPNAFYADSGMGYEFVGRRCDNGQRVMGFHTNRGLASHVFADSQTVTYIPEHWSMEHAASVPINYLSVWYGLIKRGHLRENQSVLLDFFGNGVGLAAITLCQYYNCDIFVSVDSFERMEFLMKTHDIPENRIFCSNDIPIELKIRQITNGKGVNVILKCETDSEVSSKCLSFGGNIIEVKESYVQKNSENIALNSMNKNMTYICVDVFGMLSDITLIEEFFDWMHQNSNNGLIKPINSRVFDVKDVDKALKAMKNREVLGKIVIKFKAEEETQKPFKDNSVNKMVVMKKSFFDPKKVYIIVGGLGGMGLELVHWMVSYGARKFVLTSRYGIKTDYQKYVINRFKAFGEKYKYFESNIIISTEKANTMEGAKKLINDCQWLGPIGGIFHLALALNDRIIGNQTIESFTETFDTKAKTCHNLDQLSRELNLNLDYFVVFSSQGSCKGSGGQSNYGYGLSVCESICVERRRDGLHGLAIQWGPIGDVGVVADLEEITSYFSMDRQRINCCFDKMDQLIQSDYTIISSAVKKEKKIESTSKESKMMDRLWSMIGIDPKTTPEHYTLGEIGMESMFSIHLQQTLNSEYGIKLSLANIKNMTVGLMKDFQSGNLESLKKYSEEFKTSK